MILTIITTLTFTIPPAAKVLAVIGSVYGLITLLKKIPALTPFLTGWVAVAFNIVSTLCGLLIAIPADQLYSSTTLNTVIVAVITILASAGIHGTVKSFSAPQMLGSTPPDPQVKEIPAIVVPAKPGDVPAEPPTTPKE